MVGVRPGIKTGLMRGVRPGIGTDPIASQGTQTTLNIGSTFVRLDGGAATSLYVKESGTSNTGWVGK
jgi:hypothetical protein